jgi:hypothetical protein
MPVREGVAGTAEPLMIATRLPAVSWSTAPVNRAGRVALNERLPSIAPSGRKLA